MAELERQGRAHEAAILHAEDVPELLRYCDEDVPGVYVPVWARLSGSQAKPPSGFVSRGFEPSSFPSEYFSAICDCLCFPRWHGTDPEGKLFRRYFEALNRHALFDSPRMAEEFLAYYLSFDWTERDEFLIAEVWTTPSDE